MDAWTSKTPTCQKKGLLLDKTPKEHYYEKNNAQETQNKTMKAQSANIATQKQHVMKLMKKWFKQNGEGYCKCKACMNKLCLWKLETMKSIKKIMQTLWNNKEKLITQQCHKIACNICSSLILKCNLKGHQEQKYVKNAL